ncbi:MAG: response regulator [Oligoflexales bacterium]|nr:response regulator [Oligoflexales bacterium]
MAHKILIVDDSDTLRIQLRKALEGAGYEVIEGKDGNEGLNKAQENVDVKLIITDYNMPEMDGITMCRKIREVPALNPVPIFMLTTEASPELKTLGKEAGVKAWIVKPFVADKVIGVINKVLV